MHTRQVVLAASSGSTSGYAWRFLCFFLALADLGWPSLLRLRFFSTPASPLGVALPGARTDTIAGVLPFFEFLANAASQSASSPATAYLHAMRSGRGRKAW